MAINSTAKEREKEAATDLAEKLRLERSFKPKIQKLLRRMSSDLKNHIIATGAPQEATRYIAILEGLIAEQYENTKLVFSGGLLDKLEKEAVEGNIWQALAAIGTLVGLPNKQQIVQHLRADAIVRTNRFIDTNIGKDTSYITRTNAVDLQAATDTAAILLLDKLGRTPKRNELAEEAQRQFLKHDLGRAETIAATTTQKAAEGMKQIDRDVFGDFRNGIGPLSLGLLPSQFDEFWITVGDSVVRTAHLRADGQKKTQGSFTVGGEKLRFPGDASLGASLGNIINCRCSAVVALDEASLQF